MGAAAACTQEAEADESPERETSLEFQDKQSYRENPVSETKHLSSLS